MIIGILGASGVEFAEMKATMSRMGHEAVEVSADDVSESKAIAMCGHPLGNLGLDFFPQEITIPDRDNSFRGGSRGKGGKIKYARR